MRRRNFFRNTSGAVAIEFAFTAPIFFTLSLGFIVLALWLWANFALQHSVELAARYAALNSTDSAVQTYAAQKAIGLTVSASAYTVSRNVANCGNRVSVDFTYMNILQRYGLTLPALHAQACFVS